jgi:hypothetical protein
VSSRKRNLCIGFKSPLVAALLSAAEVNLRYDVLGSAFKNSLYVLARIASSGCNIVVTHICDSLPKNVQGKKVLSPNTPSVIQIIRKHFCGTVRGTAALESLVTSKYRTFAIQKEKY